MEENKVVVNQKKSGNIKYTFGAFAFTALCVLFIFVDFRNQDSGLIGFLTQYDVTYYALKVVFAAGAVFFGYAGVYFIKRSKNGKPVLIADEKGITDHSSATAVGFIPWFEIDRIYIDSMQGNQFIELVLAHEDAFLAQMGTLKRKTLELNKKLGHQPICITLNATGVDPEDILPQIQELLAKSHNS